MNYPEAEPRGIDQNSLHSYYIIEAELWGIYPRGLKHLNHTD
jgi:hypothetical protein